MFEWASGFSCVVELNQPNPPVAWLLVSADRYCHVHAVSRRWRLSSHAVWPAHRTELRTNAANKNPWPNESWETHAPAIVVRAEKAVPGIAYQGPAHPSLFFDAIRSPSWDADADAPARCVRGTQGGDWRDKVGGWGARMREMKEGGAALLLRVVCDLEHSRWELRGCQKPPDCESAVCLLPGNPSAFSQYLL